MAGKKSSSKTVGMISTADGTPTRAELRKMSDEAIRTYPEPPVLHSKKKMGRPPVPPEKHEEVFEAICEQLKRGVTLKRACDLVRAAPHPANVLDWCSRSEDFMQRYAIARQIGYQVMADDLVEITDEQVGNYWKDNARQKLRVETRRWLISKALPKIYGDKVTTEITTAPGSSLNLTAMNLKGLSPEELELMQKLLAKAASAKE